MNISDAKLQTIQDQVISKIHWEAPDEEVLEWLEEKHGITDERALSMIALGHRKRKKAIREKALFQIFFAFIGMGITGCYIGMKWLEWQDSYASVRVKILPCFLFILSFTAFLHGLARFISGKTDTPIDP